MSWRLPFTFLVVALTLAGCVAQPPSAQPPASPVDGPTPKLVHAIPEAGIDAGISGGNEPMILADGSGTLWIGDTSGVYRSMDQGATWTKLSSPFVGGAFTDGRALALDADNTLYVATTNGQLLEVAASHDKGTTWTSTAYAADVNPIADRPWLAARGSGEVSLVGNMLDGEHCVRSVDGGKTFLDRSLLQQASANPGNLLYDATGSLWFTNGNTVEKWQGPCRSALIPRVSLPASGAQIFAMVALDNANHNYVALPTVGNGAMQIVGHVALAPSSLKTFPVSPSGIHSNSFANIATRGDEIAVAWLGSTGTGDPSAATFNGVWNLYVARVTGFWNATPTLTITQVTTAGVHNGYFCMSGVTCTAGRGLGDYLGIAYGPTGDIHLAYVDDMHDNAVHYARVP